MVTDQAALTRLETRLRSAGLKLARLEPLAPHTTYHVGGPADLFATARRPEQLAVALIEAARTGVPCLVLGAGSNLLVGDRGFRGLALRNRCDHVAVNKRPGQTEVTVMAETGIGLPALTHRMVEQGLSGLTWAEGVPGTLGGAIVGNAGAFGSCIADSLVSVQWANAAGERGEWPAADLDFSYRSSRLKGRHDIVLLAAVLRLMQGERDEERRLLREYADRRQRAQPAGPSAGSVFKNPPGQFAGRLIEEAGLKGHRIGGAHVSEKHANFIINDQGGTAADVRALITLIRQEVARRFGVELELEIELVGEF